ncbi:aminotransferase class III-fold pyridoxal phosphate-dependent enzyme [Flavobacteriaceae bacterium SZ-1-7]|uniref:aminotransferase class III-fold pyridoxal phosphate-dependent enzyme n=1 Tax=Tamlana sedimenti TaxID=3134126 RepID=UPI0031217155
MKIENDIKFDFTFSGGLLTNDTGFNTISELLFAESPKRNKDSEIIISHINEELKVVTLSQLRKIVSRLFIKFNEQNIKPGDTVFLANLETNSELFTSIFFLALCSYGVKVFLPMYIDKDDLVKWHKEVGFDSIILPEVEISSLQHRNRYKENIDYIKTFSTNKGIKTFDTFLDFQIDRLVKDIPEQLSAEERTFVNNIISQVSPEDTALMITTSGTTGASKIVCYNHSSFLKNISAWKAAGLFDKNKLGGRGFTPLFTHTMGIRTFLNGLFLGQPTLLINTDWFAEHPEVVQYFFREAKPHHITGGPGVFNIILEMSRIFPALKSSLRKHLKVIVSSGSSVDIDIIKKMEETFDVEVHNAFGTTETQQVMTTLIGDVDSKFLGGIFPGVSIGLKKIGSQSDYQLFIKSDYGAEKILNGQINDNENRYIYLGDTVTLQDGQILYCKREVQDYFNDEFGVKISLNKLDKYYQSLNDHFFSIRFYPLKFTPGLGVILLTNDDHDLSQGSQKKEKIKNIAQLINKINHQLFERLEPLEFQHNTVKRFAFACAKELKNKKGLISENKIHKELKPLIEQLTNDNVSRTGIYETKPVYELESVYTRYHNPYLGKLMKALKMDVSYVKGKKDYLYPDKKLNGKKVLDLVGGYGTNLLGHHQKELVNHAINFLKSGKIPLSDQLSEQKHPAKLAAKLNEILSRYTEKSFFTLFGSTGSEVVEMALHHAYMEWTDKLKKLEQKQLMAFGHYSNLQVKEIWETNNKYIADAQLAVVANCNAFHGNSSGARSLIGELERRKKFMGLFALSPIFIDDTNENHKIDIENGIKKFTIPIKVLKYQNDGVTIETIDYPCVIAAIIEPVIGEGGIRQVNPKFSKTLSSYNFPLIIDEIQSGLGRTGSFLASEGIVGDYYLFSKALGGNMAKISSISIDKERYLEKLGKLYVSTFSGGAMACSIALENLKLLEKYNVSSVAAEKGNKLLQSLQLIQEKHPTVFDSISGKGLMVGVKLAKFQESVFLRVLQERKVLGYLFSSYLLNKFNIRILPTISAPNVLRIEPSIHIGKKDIQQLCSGLETLAILIENDDFYSLVRHLMNGDLYSDKENKPNLGVLNGSYEHPEKNAIQVAFIGHFAYPVEELKMLDESLNEASNTGLLQLFGKFETVMEMEPFIMSGKNLYDGKVHLTTIILPLDSSSMEKLHRTDQRKKVIKKIQKAINLATSKGARFISLGGYNSILTTNGKTIYEPKGARVLTGNTLTAVVGYQNFKTSIFKFLNSTNNITVGVVGSTGNIGQVLTLKLCQDPSLKLSQLVLVGKNLNRLEKLVSKLSLHDINPNLDVVLSTNLKDLKVCDAVLTAVNTNDPILHTNHIDSQKPVIISDVSVPSAISPELMEQSNVYVQNFSASVKLQMDPDYLVTSCSPKGTSLCCVAESILNAFEEAPINLLGNISYEGFQIIEDLAKKHNFITDTDIVKSFKTY